jgi:hypothetical protein
MSSLGPARGLALAVLTAIPIWSGPAGPQPPCGSAVFPDYPEVDRPPAVKVWEPDELGRDWMPPGCTGWTEPGFSTLVATVGRFRYPAGAKGLLQRVGAISELKGIEYWSTTHQRWQTLIVDAFTLTGTNAGKRRKDFPAEEMVQGRTLSFQQEDSLSGKGTYQLRVISVSPDRIVFDTENVSTLRFLIVPIFHPGDVQSIYFLDRESKDVWRYYNIARLGLNSSGLAAGHAASSINRAVAFYRYLAGIPLNQEPPAAR